MRSLEKMYKLLILIIFITGCRVYHAPNGKAFPRSWGKPPAAQTKDYRPLPYCYGNGSSTLYHWISEHKGYQSPSGKPFPISWGKPPDIQTTDVRPLPYGYGYGSSTLYGWIMENKK